MNDKRTEFEQRLIEMQQRRAQKRGERLREERKRLGLSKVDFANMLGIHRNTQGNYEAGREPPIPYLLAVQDAGVDVAYVMEGERLAGVASQCAHVTDQIFETATRIGVTDLYKDAMAALAYLLAKNEEHSASGLDECLSTEQMDGLVRWAFSAGEEFTEAWSAIASYGSIPTGSPPTIQTEAEMILETLSLHKENKESFRLSLRDNIRLYAEAVVNLRKK